MNNEIKRQAVAGINSEENARNQTFALADGSKLPEEAMEIAAPYARRVQLAIAKGRYDLAMQAIIHHLEQEYESGVPRRRDTTLCECEVSPRVTASLADIGIETVGDLATISWDRVMAIPNLAGRSLFTACQSVIRALSPRD